MGAINSIIGSAITSKDNSQEKLKVRKRNLIVIFYYQSPNSKSQDWEYETFKKASVYLQIHKNESDYKNFPCLVNECTYNNEELIALWSKMENITPQVMIVAIYRDYQYYYGKGM